MFKQIPHSSIFNQLALGQAQFELETVAFLIQSVNSGYLISDPQAFRLSGNVAQLYFVCINYSYFCVNTWFDPYSHRVSVLSTVVPWPSVQPGAL